MARNEKTGRVYGAGTLAGPGMKALNDAFRLANQQAEQARKEAAQRRSMKAWAYRGADADATD